MSTNRQFFILVSITVGIRLLMGCSMPAPGPTPQPGDYISVSGVRTNLLEKPPNSPFSEYDRPLIDSIRHRWYDLLNSKSFRSPHAGKVVVQFRLHVDGSVSDVAIVKNTAGAIGGYLCEKAIKDCAPFAPWPTGMEKAFEKEPCECNFTFYYYDK